jgi:hypothetical protein
MIETDQQFAERLQLQAEQLWRSAPRFTFGKLLRAIWRTLKGERGFIVPI